MNAEDCLWFEMFQHQGDKSLTSSTEHDVIETLTLSVWQSEQLTVSETELCVMLLTTCLLSSK